MSTLQTTLNDLAAEFAHQLLRALRNASLCLLPQWPEHRILEFSPIDWIRTRERDNVRAQLDAGG